MLKRVMGQVKSYFIKLFRKKVVLGINNRAVKKKKDVHIRPFRLWKLMAINVYLTSQI